ncbi:MAG: hypothetical protein ABIU05_06245 [Nitrospirales bacterium]
MTTETYHHFATVLNQLLGSDTAIRLTVSGYMPLSVEDIGKSRQDMVQQSQGSGFPRRYRHTRKALMSPSFTMTLHPPPPSRLMVHTSFGPSPRCSKFVFPLTVPRA